MKRRGDPARDGALICGAAGLAAAGALAAAGHSRAGAALGAGLLIGSLNGWLARRTLGSPVGFTTSSLARLGALTTAALAVSAVLGLGYAPLVAGGLALAQLVLAAAALVSALRWARP